MDNRDTNEDKQKKSKQSETARERRRKMRQRQLILKTGVLVVLLCVLIVGVLAVTGRLKKSGGNAGDGAAASSASTSTSSSSEEKKTPEAEKEEKMNEAAAIAMQYDYDGAIAKLGEIPNAEEDPDVITKLAEYKAAVSSLVATDPTQVTHVFFHSLVKDTQKAFFQDNEQTAGFCQWMTTIDEFNRILQQMYDRGYVIVDLHDLVTETTDENGTVHMTAKQIMLPEGKIPFVISLDDLSYYHSYDGRGVASKMVLDKDGKPTCEYTNDDGSVETGAFDCVPILDKFIEEHPDFSYKGAKGTIALTGYNGILGYRTDEDYNTRQDLDADQAAWLEAHPDFDFAKECEEAKKVADAMKAGGWKFASHTWGHLHIGDISMDQLRADTDKWMKSVSPLVGDVDTIIFAHGQDLAQWNEDYASTEKFQYLKGLGFDIYCNVDSSQYFVQIGDEYLRMGRRNLDGYRMFQEKFNGAQKLGDLFDVNTVWDETRPTDPALYTI